MKARAVLALAGLALLAACGDNLEDRNAAAGIEERGTEMTVVSQSASARRGGGSPNAEPTSQGFAEEGEEDDTLEVDAGPETFIDSTEGFSPDPIDDASGFDPSPADAGSRQPG